MGPKSETNDMLWRLRVAAALGWSALMASATAIFLAFLWTTPPDPNLDTAAQATAMSCATVMVAGCTGGVWLSGLLAVMLVFAVLRR